jgi:hypothetical protein
MLTAKRYVGAGAIIDAVGHVHQVRDEATVLLSDGRHARVAVSCLLRPQAGDRVALTELGRNEVFVHAILERDNAQPASLQVPGAESITLSARRLVFAASDSLQLQSLRDIEVAAAAGVVSIAAPHVAITAVESIIQTAKQYLATVGAYALQVRSLLRLHGQQAIVTAEKDMKIDAERISVG